MDREVDQANGKAAGSEWAASLDDMQMAMFAVYAEETQQNQAVDDGEYVKNCIDAVHNVFANARSTDAPFPPSRTYTRDYVEGFLAGFLEAYRGAASDDDEYIIE